MHGSPFSFTRHLPIVVLGCILLLGILVRSIGFEHITFGYDQSRDWFESIKIITSDHIKIQGPMTDIPGLFHGSLYWYILAPFLWLTNGSPYLAKSFLIALNLCGIPLIYYVASRMFESQRVGIIAGILYALSFESIQYARWMSNPSPALIPILLTLYGLWLMTRKDVRGIVLFLLSWPFSVQFQFVLVYQLFYFLCILVWKFRISDLRTHVRILASACVTSLVLLSPFIFATVKYRFANILGLLGHLGAHEGGRSKIELLFNYFTYSAEPFGNNLVFFNHTINKILVLVFFALVLFGIYRYREDRRALSFCIFWMLSPLLIYLTDSLNAYFLNIGNLYGYLLTAAFLIDRMLLDDRRILRFAGAFLLYAILFSNLYRTWSHRDKSEVLFSVQKENNFAAAQKVVAYIYNDAKDTDFGLNTLTNPLFVNTTWAYSFNHFTQLYKDVKLPIWKGMDQKGRFGDEVSFRSQNPQTGLTYYIIYEPLAGIPREHAYAYHVYENTRSSLIWSRQVEMYIVEKRIFTSEAGFNLDDVTNTAISNGVKDYTIGKSILTPELKRISDR